VCEVQLLGRLAPGPPLPPAGVDVEDLVMRELDATPNRVNLVLWSGDDTVVQLSVLDVAGAAVDLSGFTAWASDVSSPKVTVHATVDAARAAEGVLSVAFAGEDVRAIVEDGGAGRYDVQGTDADGHRWTILAGQFRGESDVTP
jgi:hypothetical protein